MKIISTALVVSILFAGCATRNAFSKLDISAEQEKSIENTKSGQITFLQEVKGIYSAIYLNNTNEKVDTTYNNFYISLYLKDKTSDLNITLNEVEATQIKELSDENEYSHLLSFKTEWTNNYLVSFKNDENNESKELILKIDNDQFSSGPLKYLKEQ